MLRLLGNPDDTLTATLVGDVQAYAGNALKIMAVVGIVLAFVLGTWLLYNLCTRGVDDHKALWEDQNWPYAISRMSMVIAQAIGMLYPSQRAAWHLTGETAWGLVQAGIFTTVYLIGMSFVLDAVILFGVKNVKAMVDHRNWGVAAVETGSYIGLGFLTKNTLDMDEITLDGLGYSLLFVLAATAVMVLFIWLFMLPRRAQKEIAKGNMAAGIVVGSIACATGIALGPSIAGPFKGWTKSTADSLAYAFWSMVILAVLWVAVSLLMMITRRTKRVSDLICDDLAPAAAFRGLVLVIAASYVATSVYTGLKP